MVDRSERYSLFRPLLDAFEGALDKVEHDPVEAVHRTRVASRRLSELLPLLQLNASTTRKVGRELRKIRRHLGKLRELDVLIQLIEKLQGRTRYPEMPLARVRTAIVESRDVEKKHVAARVPPSSLKGLVDQLEQIAGSLEDGGGRKRGKRSARWLLA